MKHIILTSTSQIKVEAAKEVFPGWEIIAIKTPTVIEQPFGYQQTITCATTRREYVRETLGIKPEIPVISIESGLSYQIRPNTGVESWHDFAVVEFHLRGSATIAASPYLEIPPSFHRYILEAQKRGFDKSTFGQVLNERHPEIPKDNWHEALTSVSRKFLVVQALQRIDLQTYPQEWVQDHANA